MIAPDVPYVRSGSALSRRVDEDTVMFHPGRGEYFALDPIGSRVWEMLETPMTLQEIVGKLGTEFSVDESTCAADVGAFLEELRGANLVEEKAG